MLLLLTAILQSQLLHADTIITVSPELSIDWNGKALIDNALAFCGGATSIYIDTNTSTGKAMYSFAIAANAANKTIHLQTACTCNNNCSGDVAVFKMCTSLRSNLCP